MFLPETFNAGRVCYFGDRVFLVRALSLDGLATVLAWLDDVLPGRSDRAGPPELGSAASQAALGSPHGRVLLLYLALRDHGLSYAACASIEVTELERLRLLSVLFADRRTADPPEPGGGDVAGTWTGPGLAALACEIGVEAVGRLSRDQLDWLLSGGNADERHSPSADAYARAMAMYEAAVAAGAAVAGGS